MNKRKNSQFIMRGECRAKREINDKQLFVDVSTLIHVDDSTGIQRVVWNILRNLLQSPPLDLTVRPVYRTEGNYYYANSFIMENTSFSQIVEDSPICIEKGDLFLGLDLDHKLDWRAQHFLRNQQLKNGLHVYFVVYDLLAVTHPEWFNRHLTSIFRRWLKRVVTVADGLICISASVAEEMQNYLAEQGWNNEVKIGFFHLGADVSAQQHDFSLSLEEKRITQWLARQTVLLMVGTLEPRKGHRQVLDAMDEIWGSGENVLLVVVGKKGWKVEELVNRINEHPENGEHLFWFENVDDAFLLQLYDSASALLMASEGEGFGLPLIEAAQHNLPLIVRDLPVFREVAGDNAFYFNGSTGSELKDSLLMWLQLHSENKHPKSDAVQWQTWAKSSKQLLNVVLTQNWI